MPNQSIPPPGAAQIEQGLVLHRQGRLDEAAALYGAVASSDPAYADARHFLGLVSLVRGDLATADQLISLAIKLSPNDERYHLNHANVLRALDRRQDALAALDRAVVLRADYAEAWFNRGLIQASLARFADALSSFDSALALNPQIPPIWLNRGAVLRELGRLDDALGSYDQALSLKPDYVEALSNKAATLGQLQRYPEALRSYDAALALRPDSAETHYNRGNTLHELKRYDDALASYDAALVLMPDNAQARYNRGLTLSELRRFDVALESFDCAIKIKPDHAQAHNSRGVILQAMGRYADALAAYDAAIASQSDYAEALNNRGHVLNALQRTDDALASYEAALKTGRIIPDLAGAVLNTRMVLCAWDSIDALTTNVLRDIDAGKPAASPFGVLSLPSTLAQQRRSAELHVRTKVDGEPLPYAQDYTPRMGKINLGYFSPDFRTHAVAILAAGLFEQHDRSQFTVTGFAYGPSTPTDPMTQRVLAGFDRTIDIRNMTDEAVVVQARSLDIDIAIDLAGYTLDARTGVFARRAAPVQVNYLGHPGTLGVPFYDYIIADDVVIPEVDRLSYVEKPVFMPHTFQVNDSQRILAPAPSRVEVGLPDDAIVLCSFNNSYKINARMFNAWLTILKAVPESVLWLIGQSETQIKNLRVYATTHGFDPSRIIFAQPMPYAQHLARYQIADLVLDTLPFNGGATTSDALWAGVPVLTCLGNTFAGRMAASLLRAVGLPELISTSLADYQSLAIELAQNPQTLKSLRQKLSTNRRTSPLFDTSLFTRHIEDAYTQMHRRYLTGLPPEALRITAKTNR